MKFIGSLAILTLFISGAALWGGFTIHLAIVLAEAGWDVFS